MANLTREYFEIPDQIRQRLEKEAIRHAKEMVKFHLDEVFLILEEILELEIENSRCLKESKFYEQLNTELTGPSVKTRNVCVSTESMVNLDKLEHRPSFKSSGGGPSHSSVNSNNNNSNHKSSTFQLESNTSRSNVTFNRRKSTGNAKHPASKRVRIDVESK